MLLLRRLPTLAQEIAALEANIKALDEAVAEATAQRKVENAEYKERWYSSLMSPVS